ncbi:LysR family transcriptional regulator [Cytobacillus spongiae]|uniref:LysR family transcriptional regulator n=1 Tax=Cytobacillus spongiae TaxID=2901381 RepID=UPI001F2E8DA6|nr:LysR family transcriptional regulator [Cytobacillus spongiae]UII57577.1 LysR family transcriptional regulator [Cytobacillus spongiae]
MEIKQLITFQTAAECLNFTQTAKVLNFAQSSVTAQMKALEEELGVLLFERLGKRIILTEAGKQFQSYAVKMIELSEEARQTVRGEREPVGTLTIGAQESQCTYRLPPILKEFKRKFPKVKLIFKPAHSDEMARKHLSEGILDLAFIMDTSKATGSLTMERLVEEKLVWVSSRDHATCPIHANDFLQETLLLTEAGCSYRQVLEDGFQSLGIYSLNIIEFGSIEAIKQCVMADLGIALLPYMVVEKDLHESRMKQIPHEVSQPPMYTHIAWHKDKVMTEPLEAFIELARRHMNG